jgi:translation initiation factor 2 alpha subunit (eIF-2alpha)
MIRMYNRLPKVGETVIVKVTNIDRENQLHDCILLEFGGIAGKITRTECNKKDARTIFKSLKEGAIIPVSCSQLPPEGEDTFVALSYPNLDKDTITKHKSIYTNIMRVVNTLTMMLADNAVSGKDSGATPQDLLTDKHIYRKVSSMVEEVVSSFDSLEELSDAFFVDTTVLHAMAPSWKTCNEVTAFREKLLAKFPLPKKTIAIRFEYKTYNCMGMTAIQNMFNDVLTVAKEFNPLLQITLATESPPIYRLTVKGIELEKLDYTENAIKQIIGALTSDFSDANYLSTELLA